jgi:hypothetical protein
MFSSNIFKLKSSLHGIQISYQKGLLGDMKAQMLFNQGLMKKNKTRPIQQIGGGKGKDN